MKINIFFLSLRMKLFAILYLRWQINSHFSLYSTIIMWLIICAIKNEGFLNSESLQTSILKICLLTYL